MSVNASASGLAEGIDRGMFSKRLPVNPGSSSLRLREENGLGSARSKTNLAVRTRGYVLKERSDPQHVGTCHQGQPEVSVTSEEEVLRTHSTEEGGEPQGSREGRPRHPLEGRGEQQDVPTW